MPAYNVILSDGLRNILIPPRQVNENLASIPLLGRDVAGYGDIIATAQLRMLENFAAPTAPDLPLPGQLWYDKSAEEIKVYDGDNWQSVTEPAPETLGELTDVEISGATSDQFLRFIDGAWRNSTFAPGFTDLTDTPNSYANRQNNYLRVNSGETALRFIEKIPAADITGVFDINQIPLDELCDWLQNVCLPTVPQPEPVHTLVLGCGAVANVPGECSGTFEVPEPTVTVQGGVGPFTTTITLDSVTRSGSTLTISNPQYTQGSPATVDWSAPQGTSLSATLTGTYTVTVTDQSTERTVTRQHVCQTTVTWGCAAPIPDPEEYAFTVTINGNSTTSADGFSVSTLGATVAEGTAQSVTITRTDSDWGLVGVTGCGGTLSGSAPNFVYTFTMPSADCAIDVVTIGAQQDGFLPVTNPSGTFCSGTAEIGGPIIEVLGGSTGAVQVDIVAQSIATVIQPAGFSLDAQSLSYNSSTNISTVDWSQVPTPGSVGLATFIVTYDATVTHVSSGAQATVTGMTVTGGVEYTCPIPPADPTGNVITQTTGNFVVLRPNDGFARNRLQLRSDGGIYVTECTSLQSPCTLAVERRIGDWVVNGAFPPGVTAADYTFSAVDSGDPIPGAVMVPVSNAGPTTGNMDPGPTWTVQRVGTGFGFQAAIFDVTITAPGSLESGVITVRLESEKPDTFVPIDPILDPGFDQVN